MKKLKLFFFGIFLFPVISFAQCPSSAFTISGSGGCAGQSINITNTSAGAVSYNWDFCSGDFDSTATLLTFDSLGIPGLSTSACAMPVIDGTNHCLFLTNFGGPSIIRVDFGNSFNNTPSNITNLGNSFSLFSSPHGIAFIKDAGIWHALVTDFFNNQVIKLDFGNGIMNAPTSGAMIVSSNLGFPRGIDIAKDTSGNIYAAVANYSGNSITIVSFGNSINNVVNVGSPISIPNCTGPMDVSLAHECGSWYAFVCSNGSAVNRIDFGNSLLNTPVNFPQIISSPTPLSGISVVNENANWVACIMGNGNGQLYRYSIGNILSNPTPTLIGNNFLNSQSPLGLKLVKDNSEWYGYTAASGGNGFAGMSFASPCNVNNSTSNSINPLNIIYTAGGDYNITLEAIDSLGNVSYSSEKISVNPSPVSNVSIQNTCLGDATFFIDSSTINIGSIAGRHWDFGDGNGSNLQNPSHIYSLAGAYTVTLSDTSNSSCVTVDSIMVNITPKPSANFTALFSACAKTFIQFTDQSTITSGSISQWHWDFGNGDTSDLANPLYKYPVGGSFDAVLTATSDSGCSGSHLLDMSILNAPSAGFNVANTCIGATAQFTDTTTISSGSINSWLWNFGDGDTSTLQNPPHSYPNAVATYTVSLVALATDGCTDTASIPVKINNIPVPWFSFAPPTICEGDAVQLTDSSTVAGDSIYAWHWDFGDSDTATIKDPMHSYAAPGSYSITLTAYSQTSCGASISQGITVVPSPAASFVYSSSCVGDSTYFTDSSTPSFAIVSRHWDFGDGDSSNNINPTHYFDSAGTYTVQLLVTDTVGCTNFFAIPVAVHHLPVTAFNGTSGCTSTALTFFDASTSTDGTINSYSWNFGDPFSGINDSSGIQDPSHIYYTATTYIVSLTTTTIFGCSNTADSLITINQSSAANFQYLPNCEKEQMIFTNLDSLPNLDSLWSWSFGDGGVSFIPSPSHYYFLPGTYNVTLSVTSTAGCINSITKPVEVSPDPIADFVQAPACINTLYQLQDVSHVNSGTITQWSWAFGNGDTSTFDSPNTIYTDTGDYTISLTVTTSKGCIGSITQPVHVYSLPTANFNFDPLFGSPPLQVNFHDLSTDAAVYLWEFGNGDSSASSSPSYTYQDTGKFNITQIVYSNEGCSDSLTKTIYVIKPLLDIAVTNVSYRLQNNQFKVSAQVANLGTRDIENYIMQASIQNGATIDEYVDSPLLSGAQGIITYDFTAAFQTDPDQSISYYCVSALQPNGETDDNPGNNEKCGTTTDEFTVVQPFPNPFDNFLQLQFILPAKGPVTVDLFNGLGQEISVLYDDDANAGATTFQVPTAVLGVQLYFCRFTYKDQTLIFPIVKSDLKK